jgi:hypothetical protein
MYIKSWGSALFVLEIHASNWLRVLDSSFWTLFLSELSSNDFSSSAVLRWEFSSRSCFILAENSFDYISS